jgi:hypothetical protein
VQSAGVTRLNGGALQSSTILEINGGNLEGFGTLTADVASSGQVKPGLSPGLLSISGTYAQAAAGALSVEIGGVTAGSQFDKLAIAGAATLGGTLNVSLINGFRPSLGDVFQIMTFESYSGDFSTVTGLGIGNGLVFEKELAADSMSLKVVQVTTTPVPTGTATRTPTGGMTPTRTRTASPTATITPSTPIECVGDCSNDGTVMVDEIITMVNIALGEADISSCTAGDANGDGQIMIDEILTAVNNALTECPFNSAGRVLSQHGAARFMIGAPREEART